MERIIHSLFDEYFDAVFCENNDHEPVISSNLGRIGLGGAGPLRHTLPKGIQGSYRINKRHLVARYFLDLLDDTAADVVIITHYPTTRKWANREKAHCIGLTERKFRTLRAKAYAKVLTYLSAGDEM